MTKPFSQNIIFFDTEFTSLDPNKSELISIGLVKPSGEELYLELEYNSEPSEWVKKNVLPYLNGQKISKKEAVKRVIDFVGDTKPHIVGHINQDDVMLWQKLLMSVDPDRTVDATFYPFNLISIDFAAVLFALGINPATYHLGEKNDFFNKIGINNKKYNKHNALDDAKLLREVYLKLVDNPDKFLEQVK